MYERRIEKLEKIEVSASSVPHAQNVRYLTDACAKWCASWRTQCFTHAAVK